MAVKILCMFLNVFVPLNSALTLLAGWQEGHPACKRSCTSDPQRFFFGELCGGTCSNLEWK